ncbi:hypothetical protein O0I10_013026 [Lichtheimia ornata]|uniref:ISXO2-like transposase domain-containing protein n=1 Tax=Lichtheimia ornata TaxID=688661 RepID=A0AAD7UPZ7_9FUNG|nr:uncharacterized protein O0I10_013026 [Lichtheimia ornata]KAJ8651429.1 hypothetical protein O0I10_013026 [Lichtheimia ornata]
MSQQTITSMLRTSRITVRRLPRDYHLLLEADLTREDMHVGGYTETGERIIVQIDESKFGKRKDNRGHPVEGVWVLGGVELTPQRKIFLAVVPRRDAETLTQVICHFIKPGSLIHSDGWSAYSGLRDTEGMYWVHQAVNHRIEFVTEEGVHTNNIEGTWAGIKRGITERQRTKQMTPWKLIEFIWRRKHSEDWWGGLLSSLRDVAFETIDDGREEGELSHGRDQIRMPMPRFTDFSYFQDADSSTIPQRRPRSPSLNEDDIEFSEDEDSTSSSEVPSDDSDDSDYSESA